MSPLEYRMIIGWSLVHFFLLLNNREWDDLSYEEHIDVHAFIATLR